MAQLLRMPEIAANMVEAVLSEWPVAESAGFAAGDAIATVETDKAVVDVPAETDGVLLRILVEAGKSVTVGTPLAVLAAPGEAVDDVDALVRRLTGDDPRPGAPTDGTGSDGANSGAGHSANGDSGGGIAVAGRVFASPLARRIAKENGLAVADLTGTGPGGRIVRDDVHRALAERSGTTTAMTAAGQPAAPAPAMAQQAEPATPKTPAAPAAQPESATARPGAAASTVAGARATGGAYRDVPHSRMRRAIAARLTESVREAPVFTIRGSARVDALLALRAELNAASDVRISVNDLVVAAAARAHVAVPAMNVVWLPDAVRQFDDVDVAVAVATGTGLVTPVIRGVQKLTITSLARAGGDLVSRARDGKLRQDELEGGSLTVSNLGSYGTEDFTAVINPPQAAILAVGAARPEAVVTDGALGVATVLRVTLSVDHRPIDGATAAAWMAAFLGLLESPLRILA